VYNRIMQEHLTTPRILANLLKLVESDIIVNTAPLVYTACLLWQKKSEIPVSAIQRVTKLSATIIRHHLQAFETLGLMQIFRHQGSPLQITIVPFTIELLNQILADEDTIAKVKTYRDTKINVYNIASKNRNNKDIYKERECRFYVTQFLDHLPEKHKDVRVTPHNLKRLEILSADLYLSGWSLTDYTKWFVKYKLDKTIHSFGMGIFLYPGMITEFKNV